MSASSATSATAKPCRVCGAVRILEDFYARPGTSDGRRSECKICTRARATKNRDPDRARESSRAWASAHPEEARAAKQRYYAANREVVLSRSRDWVLENPERRAQTWRRWYDANPILRSAADKRRRVRLASGDVRVVSTRDLRRLWDRYNGLCAYCRVREADSLDHVTPVSRGGRHAIGNLLPACQICNRSKKDRLLIVWKRRRGW